MLLGAFSISILYAPPLLEKIGVRSGANEHHQTMFSAIIESVRQQEISADMAFTVPEPLPAQRVV